MDEIKLHRPDLFTPESFYKVVRIIPDKLWLSIAKEELS
jgi:hypothetical protein